MEQQITISSLRESFLLDMADQDPKEILADIMVNLIQAEATNKNLYAILTSVADTIIDKGLISQEEFQATVIANLKEVEETIKELSEKE